MDPLRGVTEPVGRLAAALTRRGTYAGHLRELASTAITVGLWPLGVTEELLAPTPVAGRRVDDTPVLLIHGYGANRSNWWYVSRRLHAAGFDRVHAVNYNPLAADLPHLAEDLGRRVDQAREHFGVDRVHLVGHSLGGIIARYAVQVLGLGGVDTCATIASPHGGVALARHARALRGTGLGTVAHQLRPDAPEMVLLRSSARPLSTRFVAYYANLDLIVPASRAMIREPELGATNLLVKDHGHFSMLFSTTMASSLVHELAVSGSQPAPVPVPLRRAA